MKSKVFALMFVMLALGLALVSCDDGTAGGGGTVAFVTGHYYLNGDFTSGYVARFYDDAPYFNFEKQWPNGGHSGTYSVSGRIITLKIVNSTSQAQLGQTEYWTVVDSYTIRDPDGNPWILHPDNTTSNPGGNNTGGSDQGSTDNTNRPDGTGAWNPSAHYKQTADIDLSGVTNFQAINNFSGNYDGGGYTISNRRSNYALFKEYN